MTNSRVTLFLGGDVMTGRGIDQILPCPGDPYIPERWVSDAREYVTLAEEVNGLIRRSVPFDYVWGDLRDELARMNPALRIANLETSITKRGEPWPGKAVHYRMNPGNIDCLRSSGIQICALANNHVLDYGEQGLEDTLLALRRAGLSTAGAGRCLEEAQRPVIVDLAGKSRIAVISVGTNDCGIPMEWQARTHRPGVYLLPDFANVAVDALCAQIEALDRSNDVVIVSIHWGSNWGYLVPHHHISLAHRMIDAGADLVYGHSSHHPRPIERYRGRLILYGCGDLIDDYEGITFEEQDVFRGDLTLSYFPEIDSKTGELLRLEMSPMQIRNLRLERANERDAEWLRATLDRESMRFGSRIRRNRAGRLELDWDQKSTESH
jgi:poly-gamma-glutamate synthesis protein (capsule biosynthesis protein)